MCVCISALSDTLGRSLYKGRLSFFPLDTTPVIHCVIAPAARELRLVPQGKAPTGDLGDPIHEAPRRVSAFSLRMSEALAALALQRALWNHVRFHRHSQSAVLGD